MDKPASALELDRVLSTIMDGDPITEKVATSPYIAVYGLEPALNRDLDVVRYRRAHGTKLGFVDRSWIFTLLWVGRTLFRSHRVELLWTIILAAQLDRCSCTGRFGSGFPYFDMLHSFDTMPSLPMIRYKAAHAQQREFANAVRRNVQAYFKEKKLSTTGDARLIVKATIMIALYLVPFILVLALPMSPWWGLLCAVTMGVGMAGVGMCVMHDGAHGSASKHGWVNDLMGGTMYLMGSSLLTWRIQHNGEHHTHTNVDTLDSDLMSRGLLRFSEHAPLKKINRFQHLHAFFFYGFLTITKLGKDFATLARFNRNGSTKAQNADPTREMVKLTVLKVLYFSVFLVVPLVFSAFSWWQVLIGFFVEHFVASVILGTVFQLAHIVQETHQPLPDADGVIANDWAVHEMLTTANFARENRFLTWFTGGLNFQIEHHLFPHVCHVHYRTIAPIVERTAKEFGVPYNHIPTLKDALVSHVRRMKHLGLFAAEGW